MENRPTANLFIMMIIADSGSTKTTWSFRKNGDTDCRIVQTSGINPFYQDEAAIFDQLVREFPVEDNQVSEIHFYGAGCANPGVNKIVKSALQRFFKTNNIEVASDLLAAARALCGHNPGIACILGTGSNSCYYNGREIEKQVSPLGFILGDEGSGAVLGRKLLADILKNQLPETVIIKFFEEEETNREEIMENIYRKPFPNRYAARFTRFILQNLGVPELRALVIREFELFFRRNVLQYEESAILPVHFTGSIAWYFRAQVEEAAEKCSITTGRYIPDPMKGLIAYHSA